MNYDFDNTRPIYLQLVEQLRLAIISGALKPGQKIPSVRDLATEARVNPNTMQRALTELEAEGLIYTERTSGKFVTDDEDHLKTFRENLARSKLQTFLAEISALGLSRKELINIIKQLKD